MGYEFTQDWFSMRHPHWPKYADPKPELNVLEIGSYEGRSAVWMLENLLTHHDSTITCVDHWLDKKIEARFDRNIFATGQSTKVKKNPGGSLVGALPVALWLRPDLYRWIA